VSFAEKLDAYAEVTVAVGLNLQPEQVLIIDASIEAAPLVRRIVDYAYRRGARLVDVMWSDPDTLLTRYRYAPEGSLDDLPSWRGDALQRAGEQGAAVLHLRAPQPDLYAGVEAQKIGAVQGATRRLNRAYTAQRDRQRINWSIASYPSQSWADKVFPDLPADERVGRLWEAIFAAVRADGADPVGAWREHLTTLDRARQHLQARRYRALRYRGPGTDLEVGLPDGHLWMSAEFERVQGTRYVANLPTEEVFTSPHSGRTEGRVAASMPLSYAGTLIDGMGLRFEEGRVVEAWADRGQQILEGLLDSDDGARRLGEVALVTESSPIARSKLLFLNTLFDENAACHLALGSGFGYCLDGWQQQDRATITAAGINASLVHLDFMIGSNRLDIDGVTAEGSEEAIMRAGEWAY
jgi:aminopeptidase